MLRQTHAKKPACRASGDPDIIADYAVNLTNGIALGGRNIFGALLVYLLVRRRYPTQEPFVLKDIPALPWDA